MKKTFLPILLVLAFVGVCYAQFGGPMPTTNTNPQVTTTPSPNNVPQAYNNGQIDAGWLPSTVMIFPSCSGILNYSGSDIFGNCYGSSNQIPANYISNLSESQITNLITDLASKAVLPGWTSPQTGVMTGTPPSTAPAPGNPDFWFDSSNYFNLGYGLNTNGPINTPGPVNIGTTYTTANTLAQLIADANFAGTVYLTAPVTLTANLTLTCGFRPLNGATITLGTYNLAVNGNFEAGAYQCFNVNSTGAVTFGKAPPGGILPDWWTNNATPGTTDMGSAITAAMAAATPPVIAFTSGTTYAYATSPSFALNGLMIHGNGATLKCTGSGDAFNDDAGSTNIGGQNLSNFIVQGNSSSPYGIITHRIHRSQFNNLAVSGCSSTGKAIYIEFCIGQVWTNPHVSNEGNLAFANQPGIGMFLTDESSSYLTTTITIINPIIEGVASHGIDLDYANSCKIAGGTSESNGGVGVYISANSAQNVIDNPDLEGNTTNDLSVYGYRNTITGGVIGVTHIYSGALNTTFVGATLGGSVTIDSGATLTSFLNTVAYGITDNSGSSQWLSAGNKGKVTLSSGSGSATLPTSGLSCSCTDTTAAAAAKCSVSGTTLSISGTGSDMIQYVCQ